MSWKCPECGGDKLVVMVTVAATLHQYDDNFETDAAGDHEWDGCSNMTCLDCSFCEASSAFEVLDG